MDSKVNHLIFVKALFILDRILSILISKNTTNLLIVLEQHYEQSPIFSYLFFSFVCGQDF